jgi:ABC-2 type transport system permease protein
MIGFAMRRLPPGSFLWLTLHELRLARAARSRKLLTTAIIWALLLLLWTGLGVLIAWAVQGLAIRPEPEFFTGVAAVALGVFSFMTTQALLASQRTLFESGDLDLLFSAPLNPRAIVSAKLVGIVASIALSFAFFLLPLILPAAFWGHPQLFGVPALLAALALASACVGLALTLVLTRIAGPRAARTVGQIVAALSGGAIFLVTQMLAHSDDGRRDWPQLFQELVDMGFGSRGVGAIPGRAAFGDPLAIALVLGAGTLLFAATAAGMQTLFLDSYRAGGMKLGRTKRATSKVARHFRTSLFGSVFAKEWRLLARDPALAFQIVLRLIYLAPLFYIGFSGEHRLPLGPSLAFASVLVAGQVVGSFAWLAVAGEDTPDLLKVSPADKADVDHAKLMAAMAMASPLFVLLPAVIALETIPGALVALGMTAFAGWLTGQLEISFAKPAPRSTFQRRRSGSFLLSIVQLAITAVCGGVAGAAVYFL